MRGMLDCIPANRTLLPLRALVAGVPVAAGGRRSCRLTNKTTVHYELLPPDVA
jgi:hypothetical protein